MAASTHSLAASARAAERQLLSLALPVMAALLAYLLASVWPTDFTAATAGHEPQTVRLLWSGLAFGVTADLQLAMMVGVSGGLGALVHSVARLGEVASRRQVSPGHGIAWHLLSPLAGMAVALLLHAVVRTGILAEGIETGRLNVYGVATHAALAGLLSRSATDKLGALIGGLFHAAPPALPSEADPHPRPVVLHVEPAARGVRHARPVLIVRGARFTRASQAYVNGRPHETRFVDDTQLLVTLRPGATPPGQALRVAVANPAPGGGMSTPIGMGLG